MLYGLGLIMYQEKDLKIENFIVHLWNQPSLKVDSFEATRLATLLYRVNMQKFKVEFKNIFLFFLMVLFCCNVGVSALKIEGPIMGAI